MPIVSTMKMTARQFLQLGEDPPGVRLELVNGEIAVSASPFPKHSRVVSKLIGYLTMHIDEHDLGELLTDCDTIFGEYDVRRPDILFFTKARAHLILPDEAIDGAPDLCIEVLSKGTEDVDRVDKFKQYAKGNVLYYWIFDPTKCSVEAYQLFGRRYVSIGEGSYNDVVRLKPFPKLEIALGKLWFPIRRKNGRNGKRH
jgi:Uma2 family endonuclease